MDANMLQQARCPHCGAKLGGMDEHAKDCPYPMKYMANARNMTEEERAARNEGLMNAKPEQKLTIKEMCEAIAEVLDFPDPDTGEIRRLTGVEIFNLCPKGELFFIPMLYQLAMEVKWRREVKP